MTRVEAKTKVLDSIITIQRAIRIFLKKKVICQTPTKVSHEYFAGSHRLRAASSTQGNIFSTDNLQALIRDRLIQRRSETTIKQQTIDTVQTVESNFEPFETP